MLLEALSYGLSCLVADIPANREVGLEESRYYSPGDVTALAMKMREFMQRPVSPEQKEAWQQQLRDKHDWNKIALKTLDVYENVLEPGRRG